MNRRTKITRRAKERDSRVAVSKQPFESPVPGSVWALMLLALAIRLPLILGLALWLDEIGVQANVRRSFAENLRTLHFVHFAAIKPFAALGSAEFLIRVPSLLFGVFSVGLGFLAARRLFSSRVAVLFAYFLAVVPYFINYSVDADYYSHMIFWTLGVLYFFARLMTTRRLWNLGPIVAMGPIGFFVHPFFGIFYVVFFSFLVIHMTITPAYFESVRWLGALFKSWPRRLAIIAGGSVALVVSVFVLGEQTLFGRIVDLMNRFVEFLSVGESPINASFSFPFFYDYFQRIGPAFFLFRDPHPFAAFMSSIATYIIFGLFVVGCIRLARRRWQTAVLFTVPFIISFALILNMVSTRYFYVRYFSYLTPLYWMAVCAGVVALAEQLERRPPIFGRGRYRPNAIVALAAVISFLSAPQYIYLLWALSSGEGRNWDKVMPRVADRAREGDLFVHTRMTESPTVKYYLRKYGLGRAESRRLDFITQRDKFAEAQLKDLCYRYPRLWYLWGWNHNHSKEAVRWAQANMQTVGSAISVVALPHDSTAFFWDWGGRYVLPPRIYRFNPPDQNPPETRTFSRELFFEDKRRYEVRFHLAESVDPDSFSIDIDGQAIAPYLRRTTEGEDYLGCFGVIDRGPRRIGLTSRGEPFTLRAMEVIPRYEDNVITIPGWMTHAISPSSHIWTVAEGEDHVLQMRRNSFAQYLFGVSESGTYWLSLTAKHERVNREGPYSILFELRLDGKALGVLNFNRADDTWDELGFPVDIPAGRHALTVHFVSEANLNAPAEQRQTGWVRQLALQLLPPDTEMADHRAVKAFDEPRVVPLPSAVGENLAISGDLGEQDEWQYMAPIGLEAKVTTVGAQRSPSFYVEVPRTAEGVEFLAPIQRTPPSRLIYYSARLRTRGLRNHQANMRTLFFNEAKQPLRLGPDSLFERAVNQQGIGGSTGWVRFVEVYVAPPEAAFYRPIFWVHSNSSKYSPAPGRVFFRALQIEGE